MAAEIAEIGPAHGEKIAFGVERQLGFDREIARLVVGQKRLVAFDDPFHRTPELLGRPRHQREFGIDHAAGAEIAADVTHQHMHLVGRHAEDGGEIVLEPHRAAIAGIKRVAAARRIERRERGAWLHWHAGDAAHPGVEARDVRGARKRRVGCRGVAKAGVETDIGARGLVHARRILPRRSAGLDHSRQHVVIDLDSLGAVLGGVHRFGDDHRDRLANEANLIGRQRKVRRGEGFRRVQLDFRRMLRPHFVRNRLEAVGDEIGAGQYGEHAGRLRGLVLFDAADAGVGMRRAQHHRVGLAGQVFVRRVAAAATHQP